MPSGRVRFAELTASMLWAAPVLGLLTLPAAAILNLEPPRNAGEMAYLFGTALLGTWTALTTNKALESRPLGGVSRRMVALVAGVFLGGIATALAASVRLDGLGTYQLVGHGQHALEFGTVAVAFPTYFGLLGTITAGWASLAARDRKSRFRILPILWTGLLAAALAPMIWPYERPDGIAIAAMIAIGVQIVSPWNKAASLYARYVRASRKRGTKVVSV